jgi:hypothetical protein
MRKFMLAAALLAVAACGDKKPDANAGGTMAPVAPPAMSAADSMRAADSTKAMGMMMTAKTKADTDSAMATMMMHATTKADSDAMRMKMMPAAPAKP